MHPLKTGFQISCLPLYFSTRHSDPPKTPVIKAKFRHQYIDFSAVARIVNFICSLRGAVGTSFPLIMVKGGVASLMAPRKTPISNPMQPPPKTPIADFPAQEFVTHVNSGGSSAGAAEGYQGWKNGSACRVRRERPIALSSWYETWRCKASLAE